MVRRSSQPPVTVRRLEPEQTTDEKALEQMLYRSVPQLQEAPKWDIEYPVFSPEQARELLARGNEDPSFRQRPTYSKDITRWQALIRTNRFVFWLPAGPLCFDPEGMTLNGKNRLTALADMPDETRTGFMCIYGVPRWMFKYFDTNRNRTMKDVYHIGNRSTRPQTPTVMKLALRYEECLMGLRKPTGWRHWSTVRDEHVDTDDFTARRDQIHEGYTRGERIYKLSRLALPAMATFQFYQGLAWPEGLDRLDDFCETLVTKESIAVTNPAIRLRDWTRDLYYSNEDKISAKRELHLALLFRTFDQFARGTRIQKVGIDWTYGMPMSMPYHPDGLEAALMNIKKALAELDDAVE